ncbi:DUF3471 domain-containing protein [Chitinophaga sp. GCM10012297]|uniref:DUF3471 domain-containing protein n=1 Tax=Chitinophaga chungangae TaxID=2821488 RepID=A0ABS3YKI4_9BACT|nr:DUF3471 domain-containing protein [Chitinophaga chungangae]MBO9155204.1 DUF3471 domain-containing protein [Chitinophaga chungangae]
MNRKSLLPSGAWQCFVLICLAGALTGGHLKGQSVSQGTATRDSLPANPNTPDSLKMFAVYTGTYAIPDDPDLTVVLENGKLYGIPTSGHKHLMVRTGQHQFYVAEKAILMQFEMDSYGQVAALQLSKGDQSVLATKKK